mmetsp:Transcript_29155/g.62822  ORF Transcript_29155/g.62822 Transcript_29155/m.62822 type:complete len:125 (+) Transcript_29155:109-483(+)
MSTGPGRADAAVLRTTSPPNPRRMIDAATRGDMGAGRNLLSESAGSVAGFINGKDGESGNTSLHYASQKGHLEVVRLMLEKGANTDAKGKDGATALHHASQEGHLDVMGLLLEKGAEFEAKNQE